MNPEFPRSHDAYFKFVFQDIDRARYFFQTFLPDTIVYRLNLESLALAKESYVTDDLTRHYADLVFNCQTQEHSALRICLLMEHKSSPAKFERLQLLQYMLNLWTNQAKTQSKLDGILPIIFYHGLDTWTPKSFTADFENLSSVFFPYLPDFQYHFIHLQAIDDAQFINQFNSVHAALSLLRSIWSENELIRRFIQVSEILIRDRNLFKASIVYIYSRYQFNNQRIMDIKDQLPPQVQEPFFSTYDRLISEGRNALLTELIRYHFFEKHLPVSQIADMLRVSEAEVDRIIHESSNS